VFIVGSDGSTVDTLPIRRRFLLDGAGVHGPTRSSIINKVLLASLMVFVRGELQSSKADST